MREETRQMIIALTESLKKNGQTTSLPVCTDSTRELAIRQKKQQLEGRLVELAARAEISKDAFAILTEGQAELAKTLATETTRGVIKLTEIEEEVLEELAKHPHAAQSPLIQAAVQKIVQDTVLNLTELPDTYLSGLRNVSAILAGGLFSGTELELLVQRQGSALGFSRPRQADDS
jgi:hypothetical protein